MVKKCRKCGLEYPVDSYSKRAQSHDGRCHWCRKCCSIAHARWRRKNHGKHAGTLHRWKYGLTSQEYHSMLAAQRGSCLICGEDNGDKAMCVDHNKHTGAIRGLLCSKCNTSIGLANHDPDTLVAAADYLRATEQ